MVFVKIEIITRDEILRFPSFFLTCCCLPTQSMSNADDEHAEAGPSTSTTKKEIALRREPAYWHEHHTHVKQRWVGRTLLEVMVTDFYQRTSAYYQWAIHQGHCNINGKKGTPNYRLQQGDQLRNRVHRHEPPVTADPIRVIDRDDEEGRLVVVKPGSIPVHSAGRYNKLSMLNMLKQELGIEQIWTSNRIDRLTSGIMVCSTKKETAKKLSDDFAMGRVKKAYVCRVKGKFPEEQIVCREPLLQCDRQTGVSVVHAIGKECETIFNRTSYDADTDTSVVYCRPITGRTHQIRAHVQYLGHPIPNDPIYGHSIWDRYPPQMFKNLPLKGERWKVEPESSLDVYGAVEIDEIVAGLKTDKDEKDDWSRWKDEALFTEMLEKEGIEVISVAGPNGESAAEQRLRAEQSGSLKSMPNELPEEREYCQECLVPLMPDPKEEDSLYIYLHAIKYETDDWSYEDEMPWWARIDWKEQNRSYTEKAAVVSNGKAKGSKRAPPSVKQELGPAGREKTLTRTAVKLSDVKPILSVKEKDNTLVKAPTEPCQSVVLEVSAGWEDFLAVDIQQRVQSVLPNETIDLPDYRLYTAHIIIPAGLAARAALELWKEGHLNCVHKAYLMIISDKIPTDMLHTLDKERNEKVSLQEGINQSKRARIRARKAGIKATEVSSIDAKQLKARTETEEALLQRLRDGWDEARSSREIALQEWKTSTGNLIEPTMENKLKFRGRVDRTGFRLPTLKTAEIERVLGSVTWQWLNGEDADEGPWEVDLEEPNLDVVVKMLPGWSEEVEVDPRWRTTMHNVAGSFFYLIRVRQQVRAVHRPILPSHLIENGTVLARHRAYALAIAMCAVEAEQQKPLVIWEPCVGTGSIAIELDATLRKRGFHYTIYGSDISKEYIDKAVEICRLCHTSGQVKLAVADSTDLNASVDFVGGRDTVDAIVSDPPWGKRAHGNLSVSALYPAFLKVWVEVLKPGGTVVIMTAESNTFRRALKAHEGDMRKRDTGWVLVLEKVQTNGIPSEQNTESKDGDKMRIVDCGYEVSVIYLRKRQLFD
jgi:tRNA pseudouridine synthase 8/2,5-diamino-6-(5-phospho-D-ribitylamino)-pyrimidin-4(3H)-one deaminase